MTVAIDYLIPYVRLEIGDMNPATYRYVDDWIATALILASKIAQRYWRDKYLIDDTGLVTRNPYAHFDTPESMGVVEDRDEPIIVLLACIAMLGGSLENSAWDTVSWKDAEISYSNLKSGDLRADTVKRFEDRLDALIKAPTKRLAMTQGAPLPGFSNEFEKGSDI